MNTLRGGSVLCRLRDSFMGDGAFSGQRAMAFVGGREACRCRPTLACLQKIAIFCGEMLLFDLEMTLFARELLHSGGEMPFCSAGMLHFVRESLYFIYEMLSFIDVMLHSGH